MLVFQFVFGGGQIYHHFHGELETAVNHKHSGYSAVRDKRRQHIITELVSVGELNNLNGGATLHARTPDNVDSF